MTNKISFVFSSLLHYFLTSFVAPNRLTNVNLLIDCGNDTSWNHFHVMVSEVHRNKRFSTESHASEFSDKIMMLTDGMNPEDGGFDKILESILWEWDLLMKNERDGNRHKPTTCIFGKVNALFYRAILYNDSIYLEVALFLLGYYGERNFLEASRFPVQFEEILFLIHTHSIEPQKNLFQIFMEKEKEINDTINLRNYLSRNLVHESIKEFSRNIRISMKPFLIDLKEKENKNNLDNPLLFNEYKPVPLLHVFGTHPTLTLEAVESIRMFSRITGSLIREDYNNVVFHGIKYKCEFFPTVCDKKYQLKSEESLVEILRTGDNISHLPLIEYKEKVTEYIRNVFSSSPSRFLPLVVCTGPFYLCTLIHKLTGLPQIHYFGLPILWKAPLIRSPLENKEFWSDIIEFLTSPNVFSCANNPLSYLQVYSQIRGIQKDVIISLIRPNTPWVWNHALNGKEEGLYYITTFHVLLINRNKGMWKTLDTLLRNKLSKTHSNLCEEEEDVIEILNENSIKNNKCIKLLWSSENKGHMSMENIADMDMVVIFPWEHALMTFYELYSMGIPIIMPSHEFAVKHVFLPDSNLASTDDRYLGFSDDFTINVKDSSYSEIIPENSSSYDFFSFFGIHQKYGLPISFGTRNIHSHLFYMQLSDFYIFPYVTYFSNLEELSILLKSFNSPSGSKLLLDIRHKMMKWFETEIVGFGIWSTL